MTLSTILPLNLDTFYLSASLTSTFSPPTQLSARSATMVGWQGHARWAHTDIFNLLGINPHTTNLTWEIVDARPRQIVKKLRPNDPSIAPPEGVSISQINAFRSELFSILYPSVQCGEELHAGDATPNSREELAKALDKINGSKLNGYCRTWDAENGIPGDWLGEIISNGGGLAGSSLAPPAQGSSAAQAHRATRSSGVNQACVEDEPEGTEVNPIPLDEYGTRDDPINISGDATSAPANNYQALVPMSMHQQDKFMQLATWEATPANFKYVIAPSRLRAMAQKYTNNKKSAVVIGVVRRPDWNAAQTFPEYICIASLEGSKSLHIRVKRRSVEGDELPKWPGGGSVYLSLDEIRQYGYLFSPFCDDFDKERLRRYLEVMERKDKMPMVKDKAMFLRGG